MELIIGDTHLKCYENGRIERFHKQSKKWKDVKGGNMEYLSIEIENKMYQFHRIIYKAFNPEWDLQSPLQIDHINRDKKDNRIENLRLVTHQQNQFNTNAKGYSRHPKIGFGGHIQVNGKQISKWFATEDEARVWYLEQKAIHHIIPE
jgi:hypothetical protein